MTDTRRVVLITGAAGGIGNATVVAFVNAGWQVVGIDLHNQPVLSADTAGAYRYVQGDAADDATLQQVCADIAAVESRLDALVNNAAVQVCKPLIDTTPAEWDQVMRVNVRAAYLAIRHAYPLLARQGGAVVNVSSVHAIATSANIAAYAASKGALLALTRAVAIELAPAQIRVNALLPGAVDTGMLHSGLSRGHLSGADIAAQMQALGERTVIGRVGQPDEIAQAALFLADSATSGFMTGQALVVDGGATARLSTE